MQALDYYSIMTIDLMIINLDRNNMEHLHCNTKAHNSHGIVPPQQLTYRVSMISHMIYWPKHVVTFLYMYSSILMLDKF